MRANGNVKFVNKQKSDFYPHLKKRVDAYFEENKLSKFANTQMVVKTIVMLCAYCIPFVMLLILNCSFGWSLLLWSLMGFALAGIGMSVMHDANHGAYSRNKTVNKIVGYSLNLLGGSVFNWKLQHNILHHTYTNITHLDDDISDRLVLKFSPHTPVKWFHRFQWVYAFLFYGLLTFYWAVAKDFVQFAQYAGNGVNAQSRSEKYVSFAKIVLLKIVYFGVIIGLPLWVGIPLMQVLTGFLLMHFIAGMILTTVFQLAHTLEHTIHPLPDENSRIENDWAIHQLQTTVNFSPNHSFISWYVGGLNYQIEHHLFQKISHVHYPAISKIVQETAAEYNIPYIVNPTLSAALMSHITYLKKIGKLPNLNEVMG